MFLKMYLLQNKISIRDFAKKVGVTPAAISNYVAFNRTPRLHIAKRIEIVTQGQVTIEDLMTYKEAKKVYG